MMIGLPVYLRNFGKPFIVAESVSALMTRGYYRMPVTKLLFVLNVGINLILMIVSPVLRMITVMYLGEQS